jgi:Tol biopolymer transport system component
VDVNTKQATRITEGTAYTVQGAPSWSPDGKRFVFGAAVTPMLRDNRRDVYIATLARPTGLQASRPAALEKISTNWGNDGNPRWSQDGKTIAWVGEPNTTRRRIPTAPRWASSCSSA